MLNRAAPDIVPLAAPAAENARLRPDLLAAVARVIDSGAYVLGDEVRAFEAEMAAALGVKGVVGVGSGTDALIIALRALGVGSGDEVVLPSHTAGPTAAAVCLLGAVPVLIDVDPDIYGVTPELVATALTERTKAVIVVHLYGHPVDVEAIAVVTRGAGVPLIEDCAQAQGARIGERQVGSFGDIGCFSFYPTKNLGAIGDGGALASSDEAILAKLRALRTYGWVRPQYAEVPGGACSRLDELQAAMLRIKLAGLDASVTRRRAIAERYRVGLHGLPLRLPVERQGHAHGHHLFVVRSEQRDALAEHLKGHGVMTGRHYPYAVHEQPVFKAAARIPHPLSETEALIPEILSLPLFPELTDAQVDRVIAAVRGFFAR
jgi:dTDP-4-amino-4,6-dideoxygalactose transaminase